MLEWAREFLHRLQANGIAPLEIREETDRRTGEQQRSPATKVAFKRFLREYRQHNEEELRHQFPGNRAA
jgi:hypothetical protein